MSVAVGKDAWAPGASDGVRRGTDADAYGVQQITRR
jgi:hypothetical protein